MVYLAGVCTVSFKLSTTHCTLVTERCVCAFSAERFPFPPICIVDSASIKALITLCYKYSSRHVWGSLRVVKCVAVIDRAVWVFHQAGI